MADFNDPMNASQWASRQLGYKGAFGSGKDTAYKKALNPTQQKQHADLMGKYNANGVKPTTLASQNPYQQEALYGLGQPSKPVDSRVGASFDAAAKPYDPNSYKQFMNPYLDEVINRNASNITRQYDTRRNLINEDMAAAGGFGSSAQGVERGITNEAEARQIGDMDAQLRAQGFDSATDRSLGLYGQDVSKNLALGSAYQGLDQYGRNVDLTDLQNKLYAGDRIQGQNQNVLDAYFRERDRETGYDKQVIDWYTQLLSRMPTGTTSTGTQSGVGMVPGAVGGAMLGNSMFGGGGNNYGKVISTPSYQPNNLPWRS